jgi:ABC-type nitrate/sulfonate/bicarbonate transport system substrate-binding protein
VSDPTANHRHRRRVAGAAAIVAAAATLLVAGCGSSGSSGSSGATHVTVAAPSGNIFDLPDWIAVKDGYFAQHGLDVTLANLSPATTNSALDSGSAQFLNTSPGGFIATLGEHGPTQVAVANEGTGYPLGLVISSKYAQAHHITASTPVATALKALVGSTGGSSAPSTKGEGDILLHQFGIAPSQYKMATLSSPSADQAALKTGQIDWFVTSEPVPLELQASGEGIVVANPGNASSWSADSTGYGQVLTTTASYAKAHAKTVRAFVAAIQEANRKIASDPAQAVSVAHAELSGVPASVVKASVQQVTWPTSAAMSSADWTTSFSFIRREGVLPAGTKLNGSDWTNTYAN